MPSIGLDPDWQIRVAAFSELSRLVSVHGPVLNWEQLAEGFPFGAERIRFANRAVGIFRPAAMRAAALSIKTSVPRAGREARYDDQEGGAGEFHYAMQGDDPRNHFNASLRAAYEMQAPLIYLVGIKPAVYRPIWPVYVTGFFPNRLSVTIQVDDQASIALQNVSRVADSAQERVRREYVTVLAKRRLHQVTFRENVLEAYEDRCTICRMPRRELLDAAHIVPDSEPSGEPVVSNGLSLCKLHHSAFDADLLGIKKDGRVVIAERLMKTKDGPTLEHGLKSFHGRTIHLPTEKSKEPDRDRLEWRFARFELAAKSA